MSAAGVAGPGVATEMGFLDRSSHRLIIALFTLPLVVLSWYLPLFSLQQLWIFEDKVSMISVVSSLYQAGNYLLLLLVASASMLLPLTKVILIIVENWPRNPVSLSSRWQKVLKNLSRWAMLDIWVVALLIVMVKLSAWMDAQVESGLYLHLTLVILLIWQNHYSRE